MNSTLQTIFGLLGGLAIFIFGMNMMSEGLQKVAGEKMKYILGILTKNPIIGVLAGALTTAVLQSSSATTVMVIGFVSAGLMSLPQAISVILGANIGTTMTAQVIAFQINDYIWPIVFVGFVIFFFSKSEKVKYIGQTIFAFGILFVGISTMGDVMKPLAASPVFTDLIAQVSHIPVLGVLLGTVMTLIVQSSSATIAVLQNFASQAGADGVSSVLGLAGAIPILLGDNIGTTITALLASVGQSRDAKRTAVAHSVFNITGSLIFIWVIPWFAKFVEWISPKGAEIEVISRQIANAHTTFNIANTIIWLPLIWLMVKIVTCLVPGEDKVLTVGQPQFLDDKMTTQPVFALRLAGKEIARIVPMIQEMVEGGRSILIEKKADSLVKVHENAQVIERLCAQTEKFISNLFSSGSLTEEQAIQATGLMYIVSDLDRMRERGLEIAAIGSNPQYKFSEDALKEINASLEQLSIMLVHSLEAIKTGDKEEAKNILHHKEEVHALELKLRKNHAKRLKKGKCSPSLTSAYTKLLNSIERLGSLCVNIAEVTMEQPNLAFEREEAESAKNVVGMVALENP